MDSLYNKVEVLETKEIVGTGWLPPMPDLRDYDVDHKSEIGDLHENMN